MPSPQFVEMRVNQAHRYKYKRERWVQFRREMWDLLERHFVGKQPGDLAFTMPPRSHTAKMVRKDLDAARARWIGNAETDAERHQREASCFLRYRDDAGRYLDFHAFRHTRGVWLFEQHRASPREVQELLGVGSLSMVDRHTRSLQISNDAVIERGPNLTHTASKGPMTGTIESTLESHRTDTKSLSPARPKTTEMHPLRLTWADLMRRLLAAKIARMMPRIALKNKVF